MSFTRDLKSGVRIWVYIALGLLALALLIAGGIFVSGAIKRGTADWRGETDKRERTTASGAFRQATYEEFFNLCASVQTAEASIKNTEEELATNPSAERAEKLRTTLTAQRNTRAGSITRYNALANEEHRAAFQAATLPYQLDLTAKETQCTA
ncbi:hypothetical protein [Streptomyces albidoflavus]|uniref:hypothetical protein n=1 Tax=Streptomyces albidoflavus TaxID=1886 RepID=UPI0033FF99F7